MTVYVVVEQDDGDLMYNGEPEMVFFDKRQAVEYAKRLTMKADGVPHWVVDCPTALQVVP